MDDPLSQAIAFQIQAMESLEAPCGLSSTDGATFDERPTGAFELTF